MTEPAETDSSDTEPSESEPSESEPSKVAEVGVAEVEVVAEPVVAGKSRFQVKLANFEGPFDLLLNLIGQHRLDVTEVALHEVTDDFIAYTKLLGAEMELDQTTEFLVVAATLLDLKAARLLPSGEVENDEDLALLEARDLLFARLLQYRAYKQVAMLFAELEAAALQRYPRGVSLEPRFESLLPEVTIGVSPAVFAEVAVAAMTPKPVPKVGLGHLHIEKVSVPAHALRIGEILRHAGAGVWVSFSDLVVECGSGLEVVARFLALLELYRERAVAFEQPEALGALMVSWTGELEDVQVIVEKGEDYG